MLIIGVLAGLASLVYALLSLVGMAIWLVPTFLLQFIARLNWNRYRGIIESYIFVAFYWLYFSFTALLSLAILFSPAYFTYSYFAPTDGRLFALFTSLVAFIVTFVLIIIGNNAWRTWYREKIDFSEFLLSTLFIQLVAIGYAMGLVGLFSVTRTINVINAMHSATDTNRVEEIAIAGFFSFLVVIIDIILFPFYFIILICGFRVPHVFSVLNTNLHDLATVTEYGQERFEHLFIIQHAMGSLIDVLVIPLGTICNFITFYRSYNYFSALWNVQRIGDRKTIAYRAILNLVIDLPFIVMYLILLCSWRVVKLFRIGKSVTRRYLWKQIGMLLLDAPMALSYVLLKVTHYRFAYTMDEANKSTSGSGVNNNNSNSNNNNNAPQSISVEDQKKWHLAIIHGGFCVLRDLLIHTFLGSLVFITGWRAPLLLSKWKAAGIESKYSAVIQVFIIWALDIPALICFLLILVTGYRVPSFYRLLKNGKEKKSTIVAHEQGNDAASQKPIEYTQVYFNEAAYTQFLELIIDLPFICLGILSLWRIPYLIYLIFKQNSSVSSRRSAAMDQFIEALIDIPFIVSIPLLIASLMHILTLFSAYKKHKAGTLVWRSFRIQCITLALTLPIQLPLILCTYVIALTGYRVKTTMRLANEHKDSRPKILVFQFVAILADVATILCSLVLLVTVYRAGDLIELFKSKSLITDHIELKKILTTEIAVFTMFWYFIRDIPMFILILVSSFTIWRIGYISQLLKEEKDYKKRMLALALSSALTLLDIPLILVVLVLLISWRSLNTIVILKQKWFEKKTKTSKTTASESNDASKQVEEPLKASSEQDMNASTVTYTPSLHYSIFKEFYELLVDIPFIILSLATIWRLPFLILHLYSLPTAYQRRSAILKSLKLVLLDLPYVLFTIIELLSLYRIRYWITYFSKTFINARVSKRKIYDLAFQEFSHYQFIQLLLDLPLILVISVTGIIMPWRLYTLFCALFLESSDLQRRKQLKITASKSALDLYCLIHVLTILGTVYRIPLLLYEYFWIGKVTLRQALLNQFQQVFLDLHALLSLSLITYTVFRSFTTYYRMIKVSWYSIKVWWNTPRKLRNVSKAVKEDNGRILPDELLMEVFSALPGNEIAKRVELTCKHWKQVSSTNIVWNSVYYYFTGAKAKAKQEKETELLKAYNQVYSEGSKKHYVSAYEARYPRRIAKKSALELDYEMGLRRVISNELSQVARDFLPGFLSVPLQLLFIPLIPVFLCLKYTSTSENRFDFPHWKDFPSKSIFVLGVLLSGSTFFIANFLNLSLYLTACLLSLLYPLWRPFNGDLMRRVIISPIMNILSLLFLPIAAFVIIGTIVLPFFYPVRHFIQEGVYYTAIMAIPMVNKVINQTATTVIEPISEFYSSSASVLMTWILKPHYWNFKIQFTIVHYAVRIVVWLASFLISWDGYITRVLFFVYTVCTSYIIALRLTAKMNRKMPEFLSPLKSAVFAFNITVGTYQNILVLFAKVFGKLGILGDLIMVPITLTWIAGPLYIPYKIGTYKSLYLPAIVASVLFIWNSIELLQKKKFVKIFFEAEEDSLVRHAHLKNN